MSHFARTFDVTQTLGDGDSYQQAAVDTDVFTSPECDRVIPFHLIIHTRVELGYQLAGKQDRTTTAVDANQNSELQTE